MAGASGAAGAASNPYVSAAIQTSGGLLGSLFSGGFNVRAQKRALKYNYQLWQEQKDFQREMLQREQDYNTDMWLRQNEYNSPANQVQRYAEAGVNPYMAIGNVSTGNATSSPSSGLAGSPSPIPGQPVTFDFNSVMDAVAKMAAASAAIQGARKTRADAENTEISNKWYENLLYQQVYGMQLGNEMSKRNIEFWDATKDQRERQIKLENDLKQVQIGYTAQQTATEIARREGIYLDNEQKRIINYYTESQQYLQTVQSVVNIVQTRMQIYNIKTQADLNKVLSRKFVVETLKSQTEIDNLKLDNRVKEAVIDATIDSVKAELGFKSSYYRGKRGGKQASLELQQFENSVIQGNRTSRFGSSLMEVPNILWSELYNHL